VAMLCDTFKKKENLEIIKNAKTSTELWKSLVKTTRYSVR